MGYHQHIDWGDILRIKMCFALLTFNTSLSHFAITGQNLHANVSPNSFYDSPSNVYQCDTSDEMDFAP
jgi:hypothetical protein